MSKPVMVTVKTSHGIRMLSIDCLRSLFSLVVTFLIKNKQTIKQKPDVSADFLLVIKRAKSGDCHF